MESNSLDKLSNLPSHIWGVGEPGLEPVLFSLAGIPNLCPQLWSKLLEPGLLILSGRYSVADSWWGSEPTLHKAILLWGSNARGRPWGLMHPLLSAGLL